MTLQAESINSNMVAVVAICLLGMAYVGYSKVMFRRTGTVGPLLFVMPMVLVVQSPVSWMALHLIKT